MYCEIIEDLYNNGTINIVPIDSSTITLKVQSNATITYSIQGRLGDDFDYVDITGIKDNGLSTVISITDNAIYTYDVTGYSSVKVNTLSSTDGIIIGKFYGER